MSKTQSDTLYELIGQDPQSWVETALGLKYASRLMRNLLLSIVGVPPASRRVETLGLVHSAMLLLGLAFENLLKSIYVGQNPSLVTRDRLNPVGGRSDGGHNLRKLASALTALESDEADLLTRLQEHVVWAGRYPIPTKSSRYHDSNQPHTKVQFNPAADFAVADRLFAKLTARLESIG
jgi:hypothetical protein